ncbi:MAG: hypothetical protein LBE06_12875 [Azoarcus sp.]|jgi:hypothetical protein|nr:hypothetical protein [Azoarcus sp.]
MRQKRPAPRRLSDPVSRLTRLCAVLGILIVLYWLLLARARPLPEAIVPDPSALAAQTVTRPPLNPTVVAVFTARPLFLPDRRPLPPDNAPAEEIPAIVDPFGGARLVGVIAEPEGGVAIILRDGKQRRVRQGEQFDGWTLVMLEDRLARFTGAGGDARELQLTYKHDPAGTVPPAAAKAPGTPRRPAPARNAGAPAQANSMEAAAASRRARREAMLRQSP